MKLTALYLIFFIEMFLLYAFGLEEVNEREVKWTNCRLVYETL